MTTKHASDQQSPSPIRFRTVIEGSGKNNTGIVVPAEVVTALGHGRRPPVRVGLNGHTYRSTVAVMGGRSLISLSAENRTKAGVGAGDEVEVEVTLDLEPRVVDVPEDLARALAGAGDARAFFDGLSPSQKSWHVLQVEGAKTPETRERRIAKSVSLLEQHKAR